MEETTVLIITISATLLGTLIGALFPFISSIQFRKEVYQQEVARIEFNDNSIIAQKFNLEK